MDMHFHLGPEHLILGSLAMALMFHLWRVLGALMAKGPGFISTAGKSIGGFYTFSGAA